MAERIRSIAEYRAFFGAKPIPDARIEEWSEREYGVILPDEVQPGKFTSVRVFLPKSALRTNPKTITIERTVLYPEGMVSETFTGNGYEVKQQVGEFAEVEFRGHTSNRMVQAMDCRERFKQAVLQSTHTD